MAKIPKINEKSLDWALNHIEKYGDTDIFPVPFEFEAIRFNWNNIKKEIIKKQITDFSINSHRRSLTPKNLFGFRPATQFDPLDSIIFLALIYEIGEDLENNRINKDRSISHSYRFSPNDNGQMYSKDFSWNSFRKQTELLLKRYSSGYIIVTDIADFYPRIYHHPLENILSEYVSEKNHVKAINKYINSWNYKISYGVPVGSSAIRLLAEMILNDVDMSLLADGITFCRYVDDYRIFCKTKEEAYAHLSIFANVLYENHSLTINQKKTYIMSIDEYIESRKATEEEKILDKLSDDFYELLEKIEIDIDPYEGISLDELDDETLEKLEKLNMSEIYENELSSGDDINLKIMKFIINRMKFFHDDSIVDISLDYIEPLYPIFKELMVYIQTLNDIPIDKRIKIVNKLFKIADDSIISHLEYHKQWIFETILKLDTPLDNVKLRNLYSKSVDEFSKRKIILLKGKANDSTWFKLNKRKIRNFGPWEKRAFIYSAKCLPGDEYENWLRSFIKSGNILEESIALLGKSKQ